MGDVEHLCLMNVWIGREHGRIVNACLSQWQRLSTDIDLVASRGQTIYHCSIDMQQQTDLPDAT
jgi:anhydro-N-acetylmuramic acid kinase